MKGKKKTFVITGILMVAALLVGGGSMLYAHLGPHLGWGSPEERAALVKAWITERLDLNQTQQHELEAVVAELGEKRKEMRDFHFKTRDELLSILRDESIDRSRVEQLIAEHKNRIDDLVAVVSDRLLGFADTLSREQRERLAQIIEDHTLFCH